MQNNIYIVTDKDYIAGPVRMEKPDPEGYAELFNKWEQHLASLPRIARADNGKWKIGQELELDKDFKRQLQFLSHDNINWVESSGFTESQLKYAERPFRSVAIPIEQAQPEEEFYMPPDNGDICWQIGAETFTRKEVAHLLYTQRSMIKNDLLSRCGKVMPKEMFDIINNPRKPEY